MSRIGNKVINVPENVTVTLKESLVKVEGPHGTLQKEFSDLVEIKQEGNQIIVKRFGNTEPERTNHGTTRALLANMIEGVSTRFKIELEIIGTGYRAQLQGNTLVLMAGYSHNVELAIPEGVSVTLPKNTQIIIEGIDKEVVGEFAANVRGTRKPEPYKGKGIRYRNEVVRRKEGKTAKK